MKGLYTMTKPFSLPTLAQIGYDYGMSEGAALAAIAALKSGDDDNARRAFTCGYCLSKIRKQPATQANWDKVNTDYDASEKVRGPAIHNELRAAARAWSRLLKKHGAESNHGNAGNKNAKTKAAPASAPASAPAPLPAMPKVKGELTRAAWFQMIADGLSAIESAGKSCAHIPAAEVKLVAEFKKKMAALAKIEK
jgi:hypothetical protein